MTRKIKTKLMVAVMFEPSRIKEAHLSDAYEKLIPIIKKQINAKEDNDHVAKNVFGFLYKE